VGALKTQAAVARKDALEAGQTRNQALLAQEKARADEQKVSEALKATQDALAHVQSKSTASVDALKVQVESLSAQLAAVEKKKLKAKHARDEAVLGEERALVELQKLADAMQSKDNTLETRTHEPISASGDTVAASQASLSADERLAPASTVPSIIRTPQQDEDM